MPSDASGDIVIQAIKKGQYFDINIIRVAERYIEKGTSVLDVGANFGQMSICFSSLVGETGKVYSFDADDFVFEVFKKNIQENKCINIIPIFGAVYNVEDTYFTFPKQSPYQLEVAAYGSYGINPKLDEGRKVKSLTIDSLKIEEKISFMKIDVQGSDLFAMEGAIELISKNKMPIIFEFEQEFQNDFSTTFQSYVNFVDRINYKFAEVIDGINYLIMPEN